MRLLLVLLLLSTHALVIRASALLPFAVNADGTHGLIVGEDTHWTQPTPVELEIVSRQGSVEWLRVGYTSLQENDWNTTITAAATVTTPAGSQFQVTDVFTVATPTELVVHRTVDVLEAAPSDVGFSSRFSLGMYEPEGFDTSEFFVPGIWYDESQDETPERALAHNLSDSHILIREDRLPLPLVAMRDSTQTQVTTLVRQKIHPEDGATFAGENFRRRLVDSRLQFGSMGFIQDRSQERIMAAWQFPGSEGERTYVCCAKGGSWTNRSHPLNDETLRHSYQLRFSTNTTSPSRSYADTVQSVWRRAWEEAAPEAPPVNLTQVYLDGLEILSFVTTHHNGVVTVPFGATVPDGIVNDVSSQMGFIGKALPVAAHLLRGGLELNHPEWVTLAESVIDFWVQNSYYDFGVPRTWYNIEKQASKQFRWRRDTPYMGHVRIASDGMQGILAAWRVARQKNHSDRPDWLQYAQRYGDFLVSKQAADGSIAGEWKPDGTPHSNFTNAGYQTVPFLIELCQATGNATYGDAAVKAGAFAWNEMKDTYHYIGGTPDNPNVLDKEAGVLALKAFLAIHKYDPRDVWIQAAQQAATFSETWTYSWDIPIPKDDPETVYPTERTTLGASLISTGISGADNYMASAAYDYYRLYQLTNDTHYRDFALFLEWSTKQVIDWDRKLGYSHPGLLNEVVNLALRRGWGSGTWHPWLTVGILDPLVELKEETGSFYLPRATPPSPTPMPTAPPPTLRPTSVPPSPNSMPTATPSTLRPTRVPTPVVTSDSSTLFSIPAVLLQAFALTLSCITAII